MSQNPYDTATKSLEFRKINFYEITQGEVIGRGSFGTVIKGLWQTREVAIKIFQTDKELLDAFCVEVHQLSRVNHPNIVKLFGASTKPPHMFLVMEYAECGSLYKVLHQMKETVSYHSGHAISWLLQCAKGVEYLHTLRPKPIVHRDLKSPNLLLVDSGLGLKLCDFGTACNLQTYMTNNKGSAAWMAPEVFEGNNYTEKCDIYSVGILIWEVLTRRLPFDEIKGNDCRILWAIHQGQRPPLISGCPEVIEDLMTKCWDKNTDIRPTMSEIVEELSFIQRFFPSVKDDRLIIEKCFEDDSGSYVSALASSQSEVKPLISSTEEYPERLPHVVNTNSDNLYNKKGYFTPPEFEETYSEIPSLPIIDPSLLRNAPPELIRSCWTDDDSGPIPSDIEVFRDRSSGDILTSSTSRGQPQIQPNPPKLQSTCDENARAFFEYRRQLEEDSLYYQRYPLSDFRPRLSTPKDESIPSQTRFGNDEFWQRNMPYDTLSGRNYPSFNYPYYKKSNNSSSSSMLFPHGKTGNSSSSPRNLSSSPRTRGGRGDSRPVDINGLFSVHEDTSETTFKKGHRRASSYGSTTDSSTHIRHPDSNLTPSELRRSCNDVHQHRMYNYYDQESLIQRAVEMIDPELRPVPPQPNCPQSMQIYHDHRLLATDYVEVKNEIESLRRYKASLEKKLQEAEQKESSSSSSSTSKNPSELLANQEDVEMYVRKRSERDSLLQFRDKLSTQLQLIKTAMYPNNQEDHEEDWVLVNSNHKD